MGRKFGFSFSWKRALGVSSAKRRISRKIGIPLTKSGRRKKVGRMAGCFVATAVYGGENSIEVLFFRAFRDEVLVKSYLGRFLIMLYYKVGPFAAWFIGRMPVAKCLARGLLNRVAGLIEQHTYLRREAFQYREH